MLITEATPDVTQSSPPSGAKAKKPRKQRENVSRYPHTVSLAITVEMARGIMRMCPSSGPFNQSTYLRLLLHRGLLTDDPSYASSIQQGDR